MLSDRDVVVLKLALERSVLDAAGYLKVLELLQRGERLGLGLRQAGVGGPVVSDLVAVADVQAQTGAVLTRCDAENTLMRRFLQSSGVTPAQLEQADGELKQLALAGQFCTVDEVFVNRGWLDLLTAVALRKRVKERLATCTGCWRHFLLQPGTRKVRCPACRRVVRAGEGISATDACRQLLTESQQQAGASAITATGAHRAITGTGAHAAVRGGACAAVEPAGAFARPPQGGDETVASPDVLALPPPGTTARSGGHVVARAAPPAAAPQRPAHKTTSERFAPPPPAVSAEARAAIPLEEPAVDDLPRAGSSRLAALPEVELPGVPGVAPRLADTATGSSHDDLVVASDFDESSIADDALDPEAVARFGPYEILSEVARGAMGIVYKARKGGAERPVALKVLMAGEKATPKQVARFEREAEATRRFQHPGIVRIEETGAHQGYHFIAMEFVEGETLERVIRSGPMEPTSAARVIKGVADAVACIHRGGVVHRDLKPGNIIVPPGGQPKLIDFGLAKVLEEEKLTRTGVMVGTPYYMAPEQVRSQNERVGPPSDVYGLGAILYEMLLGRPPFKASNYGELFAAIVNAAPPRPTSLRPELPAPLEAIVLRCLAKEPADRYPSAAALVEDLERFLGGERTAAASVGRRRDVTRAARLTAVVAGAVALVLAVAVGGHWVLSRGGADVQQREQVQRLAREAREHMSRGNLRAAARVLTAARALDPARADLAADLARCLVAEGEVEDGVRQLEEAVLLGWTEPALLDMPELAPVRDDPRVRALRERLVR